MDQVSNIRLITGNANQKLAEDIAAALGIKLTQATVGKFSDGEANISISDNVRGADVYIIQPTCHPVNDNLMELLLLQQTLLLSSAKRVTCVVPYFGYARQDRKTKPRVPISASLVATLIEAAHCDRVVTLDLHSGQIQGFFKNTPVDNLYAEELVVSYLKSKDFQKDRVAIVSPDAGGVVRARRVADKYGAPNVVSIIKRRTQANVVDSAQIVGDIQGLVCVIVDDMIDTAGTLAAASKLLKEKGAASVYACASHGVLSGKALENINHSLLEEVVVTDSIPQDLNQAACPKLKVISVAPLLAEVISRIHSDKSLSSLFEP